MLLVVGHPGIGAALETLLRIEDRYEVMRASSPDQVASGLGGWTPDLVLVDGVIVESDPCEGLTMPALVLSGNVADGKRLAARLPDGRGWLRKDATAYELRSGIDQALARGGPTGGRRRNVPVLIGLAVGAAVIILSIAMYALGGLR